MLTEISTLRTLQIYDVEKLIRRALDEGDTAKADRLRRHWRSSKGGCIYAP